jgi:DNA (cytosine-5)-methyltransferase 3A
LLKDILESEVDEKYFLSDAMLARILRTDNYERCFNDNEKALCLAAGYHKGGRDNQFVKSNGALALTDNIIIHNLMPRSSTSGKGGIGHLSRNDGKTYCLDTGNTNAVEVRGVRQLNRNNESNNNTQPFQQNRVYDINGISPALQAQLTTGSTMLNTPRIRRLTPTECERLQTVKDGYTEVVSDTQRYRMLGNGWTVEVIKHIFSYLNNI